MQIEKKLRGRLIVTLAVYIIVGFILTLVIQLPILPFSAAFYEWIHMRNDILLVIYLVLGINIIFFWYWRKPWNYLREVIDGARIVTQPDDSTIQLSEPLKELEEEMNQLKMSVLLSGQAVKAAEDRTNELVMYLAHDIRTPLTSVIGYLSLLIEAPDMPAEQKAKYTNIALAKAQRLEVLINEFFDITRYNSRQITLAKTPVDLEYLLIQLSDEFYPALAEKNCTITLQTEEDLAVNADPDKIGRVFNNLLKNAVSYSYPGTEIQVTGKKEGGRVIIIFQNRGPTIPPDKLSLIFNKFNRLDEARKSDSGGTGLGLSIAEEIIHLHGGEIVAASDDEIITFTVSLPVLQG